MRKSPDGKLTERTNLVLGLFITIINKSSYICSTLYLEMRRQQCILKNKNTTGPL